MAKAGGEGVPDAIPDEARHTEPDATGPSEPKPYPRRFALVRNTDEKGMSGEGVVAYGVQFPSGQCAYRWNTDPGTIQLAKNIYDVQYIHGHEGRTEVEFLE